MDYSHYPHEERPVGYNPVFLRRVWQQQKKREKREKIPVILEYEFNQALPAWVKTIIVATARKHGIAVPHIMSKTRKKTVVFCRQEAMYRLREFATANGKPCSWLNLGRWFGFDHTTTMWAVARHAERSGEPDLTDCNPVEKRKQMAVYVASKKAQRTPENLLRNMPADMRKAVLKVSRKHGLKALDVLSPVRGTKLAECRHECMYECRQLGHSYLVIGTWLARDHKTVMHGVSKVEAARSALDRRAGE